MLLHRVTGEKTCYAVEASEEAALEIRPRGSFARGAPATLQPMKAYFVALISHLVNVRWQRQPTPASAGGAAMS